MKKHFAVIKTGGKQYVVSEGDTLSVEKLGKASGEFSFDSVLLVVNGETVKIGTPTLKDASVKAEVIEEGKGKKKMVFRYKSKTRYRKKKGHRQIYTKVRITKIPE